MIDRIGWYALLLCFGLAACSGGGSVELEQHASDGERQHSDGHGHGEGVSVTHYTDATELFVEFPPLVQGNPAEFAAHLTRLDPAGMGPDTAVSEGTLTVILDGGGIAEERVSAQVSATPGIFRPVLIPKQPGKRNLTFHLAAPGIDAIHEVGEVQVYADAKSAEAVSFAAEEGDESIRFTKEQQWKLDFATRPAVTRRLRESVAVTAIVKPRGGAEARISAPGSGLINAGPGGFPRVGMQVASGDVLGYLMPQLGAETDIATLQLSVERARINVERAEHELQRLEALLQLEAVPAKRVQEARHELRLAQAEVKAAEDRAATYQGGGGGIALKSPIHGVVVDVPVNPGGAVQAGQALVHVADLRRLWLEARVAEADLGRMKTPSGVFFQLDGHGSTVLEAGRNSRLVAFGGLVDPVTRTVPAIFEFENPGGRLKAGMHVRAVLFTGVSEQAVALPVSAVVDDNGKTVVFVQVEGESFERRMVMLGPRDGDWVAVRLGLVAGERVVTRGAYHVRLAASAPATIGHGHAH